MEGLVIGQGPMTSCVQTDEAEGIEEAEIKEDDGGFAGEEEAEEEEEHGQVD